MSAVIPAAKATVRKLGAVDLASRLRSGRGAYDVRGPSGVNVHETERLASVGLGMMLLLTGLLRRSLGFSFAGGALLYRGITGHSYLYRKLNLHTAGGRVLPKVRAPTNELDIRRSMTIGKPAGELYRMWRDPKVQSQVMADFADVRMADGTWRWSLRAPIGRRIEWETQVTEEREGEAIRWRSLPGSMIGTEGSVEFRAAPAGRGTEVRLSMRFSPPGGSMPAALPGSVGKLIGFVPKQAAYRALWRFKSLAETGDILSIRNQPAARNDGRDR